MPEKTVAIIVLGDSIPDRIFKAVDLYKEDFSNLF